MQDLTRAAMHTLVSDLETDLARARWLANWMDAKFSIMGVRFGLEGILGLLPVAGDTMGAVIGMFPVYVAMRHKLGLGVIIAMGVNLFIEWLLGFMPFIGDAADIWFKANLRNLKLLERAAARARPVTASVY